MPHANAHAAAFAKFAIAVTEVVGVLVMVGSFLESRGRVSQFYAMPIRMRKLRHAARAR